MSFAPLVSCVIPFRDAARWLPDQLAALAAQTYAGPREFIFADNGSRDDGPAVIEAWRGRLGGDVVVVDASARPGAAAARNLGAAAARARWLAWCDADDRVNPGWLEALTGRARETGAELVGGRICLWDGRPGPNPAQAFAPTEYLHLGHRPICFAGNLLIQADAFRRLGGWDEDFATCEDVDLAWRAQAVGMSLTGAPEAILDYRRRDTLAGVWRQHRAFGEGDVLLLLRHRLRPARGSAAMLRDWRDLARILKRGALGRALPHDHVEVTAWLARKAGHLSGSLRHGRFYF